MYTAKEINDGTTCDAAFCQNSLTICYPRPHSHRRGYCVQSCLSVCLFVRAVRGQRLELSTPNLVHVYSLAVAQHASTQRVKGHRSRSHGCKTCHGRTVVHVPESVHLYAAVLPAAVSGVGLQVMMRRGQRSFRTDKLVYTGSNILLDNRRTS